MSGNPRKGLLSHGAKTLELPPEGDLSVSRRRRFFVCVLPLIVIGPSSFLNYVCFCVYSDLFIYTLF